MTTHALTEIQRRILSEISRREKLVASHKPSAGEVHEFADQRKYGPKYLVGQWFHTAGDRTAEKRFLRGMLRLESLGLIVGTNNESNRLTWVKLTDAGRAAHAGDRSSR